MHKVQSTRLDRKTAQTHSLDSNTSGSCGDGSSVDRDVLVEGLMVGKAGVQITRHFAIGYSIQSCFCIIYY